MTEEKIRTRLADAKKLGLVYNKEIGKLDKVIRDSKKRKAKLAKMVSKNMLYRNNLINSLSKVVDSPF